MTREQTLGIMAVLRGAYPSFYRDMPKQEALDVVNLWAEMFADDDPALVAAAVKALIASDTKGFPPHIGAVKEQMRKLTAPGEMSEAEAWTKIKRAISNGLYGSREEFDRLPPLCQKLVGSPSQLRDWAALDSDELNTVVASNVQRAFRTMQQRENETAKLPGDVRDFIAEYSARFALNDHSAANLPPASGENREDVKSTV